MGRFFLTFFEILLTYPSFFKHSAIAFFILEYGKETDSLPARLAFFSIIIMFEIESIVSLLSYRLDLRIPGSIPSLASSLKQMRHIPKSLIKPLPRPQRKHRFFCRV